MEQSAPNASEHGTPTSETHDQLQLKKAVTAAAIAAASSAAPGQRERVVTDAIYAASAVAETAHVPKDRLAVPEQSLGTAGLQDGVYMSPQWGESPPTEDVEHISIDVLKGGSLLQTIPIVPEKTFFTFGRAPVSDVRVDHTSTSRLHAVLQFRGRAAFLVDMGSTHGSTLHGHRLEPYLFHRVNVGSQFVLGQSTRSYVFNAPQEWQPPEGPNSDQRKHARLEKAVLERAAAAAERDKIVAAKTMQAAMLGRHDWDVEHVDVGGTAEIDWRYKMEKGALSDKQLKIAESIRRKEYKLQKTQEAATKLRRREGPDQDLTSGQAAALLNNEKAIDRLQGELDDLEETMQESLQDSQHGRESRLKAQLRKKWAKRSPQSDSDGDDEFFDRTEKKKAKPGGQAVLTVKTLLNKLKELQTEEARLMLELKNAQSHIPSMHTTPGADAIDSLMRTVQAQGAQEDAVKLEHLLRLTKDQICQQHELLDIADPHQEQRLLLSRSQ